MGLIQARPNYCHDVVVHMHIGTSPSLSILLGRGESLGTRLVGVSYPNAKHKITAVLAVSLDKQFTINSTIAMPQSIQFRVPITILCLLFTELHALSVCSWCVLDMPECMHCTKLSDSLRLCILNMQCPGVHLQTYIARGDASHTNDSSTAAC